MTHKKLYEKAHELFQENMRALPWIPIIPIDQKHYSFWQIENANTRWGIPLYEVSRQAILRRYYAKDKKVLQMHNLLTKARLLGVEIKDWPPFEDGAP